MFSLLHYGFSYEELKLATKGFNSTRIIGHGAFGTVYKGILSDTGGIVAVKRCSHNGQGKAEFLSELSIIGTLRHRNLVRLQGWCHEKGEILLVYDLMPNGSLDKALFESRKVLPWSHRRKILLGVASALAYLHQECENQVIHRDIKSSNIMLDEGFNARLGDFGLARQVTRCNDGFFSYELEDWNSTSDCCSWDRVICDSRPNSRAVIALYLDSLQSPEPVVVSSSVLAPLFGIKSLMMLILSSNHIQSQIAGEGIANLGNLVHLDLMQSNFTGSIPPQVFHLRHLQYLDLSGNLLTGVLKPEVGYLQKLRILKLGDNFIGGNISMEIGNLTKIQELSLRNNHFSGGIPLSVLNLKGLKVLDLRENLFSQHIPTMIGRLSNLST
ncbi:hypothetical protein K7X08_037311 [Anisodus acutangulus]|uniref:non-specific serine/threonine protein kinase n=1 Tax=Anisodus acutangulus TaxID=402998 RepID=A0A9Q1MW97_9SOLA|nr:hypothetical protein K7X08_037311 [Anisodus acutangulus]